MASTRQNKVSHILIGQLGNGSIWTGLFRIKSKKNKGKESKVGNKGEKP